MKRGLIFLSLFLATPLTNAEAYVRARTKTSGVPLRWMDSNCAVIRPNSKGSIHITDGSALTAIQKSVQAWQTAITSCSYFRLDLLEARPDANPGVNKHGTNENTINFVTQNWPTDPTAAGITTLFFIDEKGNPNDGRILDADILLNDNFVFGTTGEPGKTDVQNTVTHELGHLMGLDHTCDDGSRTPIPVDDKGAQIPPCSTLGPNSPLVAATMFNYADPGETYKRVPHQDDIHGVCAMYPIKDDPGVCAPVDLTANGGCSITAATASSAENLPQQGNRSRAPWLLVGCAFALFALTKLKRLQQRAKLHHSGR